MLSESDTSQNDEYFRVDQTKNTSVGSFLGILTSSIFIIAVITFLVNAAIAIFKGKRMFSWVKLTQTSIFISVLIIALTVTSIVLN